MIGILSGKDGAFVLHYFGGMYDNDKKLVLGIVPYSGFSELTGFIGTTEIRFESGQHFL